jgi:hypothetical protein
VVARKRDIPKVVEAERFILRDGNGRPRAILKMAGEDPFPAFELLDENGLPRVMIHLEPSGRVVARLEATNGAAIGLSADNAGTVGLSLSHPGGMPILTAGCHEGEEVYVVISDRAGRPMWQWSVPFEPASAPAPEVS